MRKSFPEVFKEISDAAPELKPGLLKKYDNPSIRTVLATVYHPDYKWDLPPGAPPYKTDKDIPIDLAGANLYHEARRLYIFDEATKHVTKVRKEILFVGMLEGLHYTEAEMLIAIKDGEFEKLYPGINEKLIRENYLGLLPETKKVAEEKPKKAKKKETT